LLGRTLDADHLALSAQAVLNGATGRIGTGSSRTLALLGLLLARTGWPQDRATIAGQFWPESGNGQALTICAAN
jgi:hypothetical protein